VWLIRRNLANFWAIAPCVNRRFGGTYHLHLQDWNSAKQEQQVTKQNQKEVAKNVSPVISWPVHLKQTLQNGRVYPTPYMVVNGTSVRASLLPVVCRRHCDYESITVSSWLRQAARVCLLNAAFIQDVSKRALQRCSKCYCVTSVTKTFTLKGVQIIHRLKCSAMDSLYAFKCKRFCNTRLTVTFGISL
jgi:hypothetical protein